MFKSYSTNTTDFLIDQLFKTTGITYTTKTNGIDHLYDFTPVWKWAITDLPSKSRKEEYPDYPKCNHAISKEGKNIFEIACTSFREDEIEIEVKDDYVIVSAESTKSEYDGDLVYLHRGLAQRNFKFAINLSDKFDTDKIEAKLTNGLLYLTIPLKEEITKKNRKIEFNK